MKRFALAACVALGLGGCTTVSSTLSGIAVSATTAGPTQAKTVAEAIQATTLFEKSLDLYMTAGAPNKAVLQELQILVPALHNALSAAETANASGNSALIAAALATFNEALGAVQSYEALKGVAQS